MHSKPEIARFREQRAVRKQSSLLEFLGYIFFFGGVLVGPCFEITDYRSFVDRTMFPSKSGRRFIPSSLLPSLKVIGFALICFVGHHINSMVPVAFMATDEFCAQSLVYKILYMMISVITCRFKYYLVWYLGEAGCVAAGLGYSGPNGEWTDKSVASWNRVSNVNSLQVELATSVPQLTNNWNMGVNNWLKNYVYYRVMDIVPNKSLANIVTKLTSAFWHGFYGGYYIFFLGAYFVNEADEGSFSLTVGVPLIHTLPFFL